MSVHVSAKVWDLPLAATDKLVLLKLADCADRQGENAYPSVATIAKDCGLSERTVQRSLRDLEANAYLTVTKLATPTFPRIYRVNADGVTNLHPVTDLHQGGAIDDGWGDTVTPDPSIVTVPKPSNTRTPGSSKKSRVPVPLTDGEILLLTVEFGDTPDTTSRIEQAMAHEAALKYPNGCFRYVQNWLKRPAPSSLSRFPASDAPRAQTRPGLARL